MPVKYKSLDGVVKYKDQMTEQELQEFSGYKIEGSAARISYIEEYKDGDLLGKIILRMTKAPIIFRVVYKGYNEIRYNTGSVSSRYCSIGDDFCGEMLRYDMNGKLQVRDFLNLGKNVTDDIVTEFGISDILQHEFTEEELFRLYMKYDSGFRFVSEYNRTPEHFDSVLKACLE